MWQKVLCLLVLWGGWAQAETIYRCESPTGKAIFSDAPCGPDAQEQALPEATRVNSNMAVSPAEQKRLDADLAQQIHKNRVDSLDNAIANKQQQLIDVKAERDANLRRLADQLDNVRGPVRNRQQVEVGIARQRYQDRIKRLEEDLRALRKDRNEAARY